MPRLNKLTVAELMKNLNVTEEVAKRIVDLQVEARPMTKKYVVDLTEEQLAEVKVTFPELEFERKTQYKPKKKEQAASAEAPAAKPKKEKPQGEMNI